MSSLAAWLLSSSNRNAPAVMMVWDRLLTTTVLTCWLRCDVLGFGYPRIGTTSARGLVAAMEPLPRTAGRASVWLWLHVFSPAAQPSKLKHVHSNIMWATCDLTGTGTQRWLGTGNRHVNSALKHEVLKRDLRHCLRKSEILAGRVKDKSNETRAGKTERSILQCRG